MDDPVADSERAQLKFVPQPATCEHQGGGDVRYRLDRIGAVGQRAAARVGRAQPGTAADPVHLPFDLPMQPTITIHAEYLEFDA